MYWGWRGKKEASTRAWQSDKSMAFCSCVQTTPERTTPCLSFTVQRFGFFLEYAHVRKMYFTVSFFFCCKFVLFIYFFSSIFAAAVWFLSIVEGNDKYSNVSSNQFYKWLARGSRTGSKVPTKVNTFCFVFIEFRFKLVTVLHVTKMRFVSSCCIFLLDIRYCMDIYMLYCDCTWTMPSSRILFILNFSIVFDPET